MSAISRPLVEARIDTLVLGCTHYPLLRAAIGRFLGPAIRLVDSAQNCALSLRDLLQAAQLAAPTSHVGRLQVALTDASEGFLRVAQQALTLEVGEVQLRAVPGIGG